MGQRLVPRWAVHLLIAGIVVLPIAICVILGVRALLVAMDDLAGGEVLRYIAWGCGVLWLIDLVSLVLAQGLNALGDRDEAE